MSFILEVFLLAFLTVAALAILRMRDLFAITMLFSLFSLLSAGLFTVMDAADVAFTEAAVGAGISTILMLVTLTQSARDEKPGFHRSPVLPLVVVWITGGALLYGTRDLPTRGDPTAPVHTHVAPRYLEATDEEIGIPNVVTAVLASYRGYDTLGETTVILTAGIGVLALLGIPHRRRRKRDDEE